MRIVGMEKKEQKEIFVLYKKMILIYFIFLFMYSLIELIKLISVFAGLKIIFDIDLMEDIIINIREYQIIKLLIDLSFIYSILNAI